MIARIVLIITLVALSGCGSGAEAKNSVVAAFYPLAFAAQTMSPSAKVENLTPPGAEPHDLELTPQAVARIQRAAVVLYLGNAFQPAVAKAVSGNGVDLLPGDGDPHVWLDPVLYARTVRKIAAALDRPATPLLAQLRQLDAQYRRGLRDCRRREIVTSHEAFGYLARRYRL